MLDGWAFGPRGGAPHVTRVIEVVELTHPVHRAAIHQAPLLRHATWAVIAGMAGTEENRIYDRPADDGPMTIRATIAIQAGVSLSLGPAEVHRIHISSAVPSRTFHLYGRGMGHMHDRVQFDMQTGRTRAYDGSAEPI